MAEKTPVSAPASQLYQRLVLEHYRRPRNRGSLPDATHRGNAANPLCGDDLTMALKVAQRRIEAATFSGRCCAVSQAVASLLTEALKGKALDEALRLCSGFRALMRGEEALEAETGLGELEQFGALTRFPARVPCALLPCSALEEAIASAGKD
ncbi:MAG: iron-sulfur cluster assembly scaffold protein [Gemmatimonadales bacterium]|nr:MAG: iron-sulfur cluster assembly scaffold protein [Gemmatimonadales bacterium]